MVARGEGVTRLVLVFSQGEDRIVNAQPWIKLKLPVRRQEREASKRSTLLDWGPRSYLRC